MLWLDIVSKRDIFLERNKLVVPEQVPVAKHSSSFVQSWKISTKHLKIYISGQKHKENIKSIERNLRY